MADYQILNEVSRQRIMSEIDRAPIGCYVSIDSKKKYSNKQRGALHVWCQWLATELNDAGRYRVRVSPISSRSMEVPWTMSAVKEDIYKPVLAAIDGKDSTEKQKSADPSQVALIISKHFGDTGLICPPWPSSQP